MNVKIIMQIRGNTLLHIFLPGAVSLTKTEEYHLS